MKLVQSGRMTVEDVLNTIKRLGSKSQSEDCQKIVTEAELSEYLNKGWKVHAVFGSGKIVISNEG